MKGPSLVSLGVEVIYLGWELFKIKSIVDEHNENKEVVMKNDNGKEIIAINIPKSHFQLSGFLIVFKKDKVFSKVFLKNLLSDTFSRCISYFSIFILF
ncbi:TPA: hypothetical protein ACGW6U_005535 [Bacillus cereus]